MSVFEIPHEIPRRARLVLFAALMRVDATGEVAPTGKPPSALTTLMKLTGHDEREVRRSLRALESSKVELDGEMVPLATSRMVPLMPDEISPNGGAHSTLSITINLGALKIEGGCPVCGCPSHDIGHLCPNCKQSFRADRKWMSDAVRLHYEGYPPLVIASKVGKPLYVGALTDEMGRAGAVVPMLLHKGLLGPEWAERLRKAQAGASIGEED